MTSKGRNIDHIVYCVTDMNASIRYFEEHLGISPIIGGQHMTKGTKNALINLGNGCYLEILAIDNDNKAVSGNRWMGIDHISNSKTTRWCIKSDSLESDSAKLSAYNAEMGAIERGNRKTPSGDELSWSMILPLANPEVELAPFMTDWSSSAVHPTDNLLEQCQLIGIALHHPDTESIQDLFGSLDIDYTVIQAEEIKITLTIEGPKGILRI